MKEYLGRLAFFFRYAWFFSVFVNLAMLTLPLYMLQVYDRVLVSRSLPTLIMLTLGAVFVYLVYIGLEAVRARMLVHAGRGLDQLLAGPVLSEAMARSALPSGDRHAAPIRDVSTLRQYVSGSGPIAFFDAPWSVIFLGIIFVVHWWLGAMALVGMLLLVALAAIDEWRTRPLLLDGGGKSRSAWRSADLAARNAQAIAAMGMQPALTSRWLTGNASATQVQSSAAERSSTVVSVSKGLRQLLQVLMLGLGAYLVVLDQLTPGAMIASTILLGRATAPIELAIAGWRNFVDARAAYARLSELLVDSRPDSDEILRLPPPHGAIEVDRVVFAPVPGQPPLIKGISFDLPAGETLAIIGPSAAGKSTLLRLLLGIWHPQSGSVRLDGADVAQWPRDALGPSVGYLPQEVELLEGTVGENIARMGRMPDSSDAVLAAAKRAGAHEMILKLTQGYETPVGESGVVLSGGQRQRIGLARALFGAPKVVMLDEPNANLDSEGEAALTAALRELKRMRTTVLFVTHKPALLAAADRILVLAGGSVVAYGPRDEVLAKLKPSSSIETAVVATT